MKFTFPSGADFEIPDEWWVVAQMPNFIRQSLTYNIVANPEVEIIPIKEILPPLRNPGFEFDSNGFYRDRLVGILSGFVLGNAIPPIHIQHEIQNTFSYTLRNGFHRFYASAAAGFDHIPAIIVDSY